MFSLAVEGTETVPPGRRVIPWTCLFYTILLLLFLTGYILLDDASGQEGAFTSPQRGLILGAKENAHISRDRELWRLQSSLFTPMMQPEADNRHLEFNLICLALSLVLLWTAGAAMEHYFGSARFLIATSAAGLSGSLASVYFIAEPASHPWSLAFAALGMSVGCRFLLGLRGHALLETAFCAIMLVYGFYAGWPDRYCDLVSCGAGLVAGLVMPGRGEAFAESAVGDALKAALVIACLSSIGFSTVKSYENWQGFRSGQREFAAVEPARRAAAGRRHSSPSYGFSFEYPVDAQLTLRSNESVIVDSDAQVSFTVDLRERDETEASFLNRQALQFLNESGLTQLEDIRVAPWAPMRAAGRDAYEMGLRYIAEVGDGTDECVRFCALVPLKRVRDSWLRVACEAAPSGGDAREAMLAMLKSLEVND